MSADPPEKLYFRIGEAAALVGVKPHVLRYWEQEFRFYKPKKSGSGQRIYNRRDVERFKTLRTLLHDERYTIEGARKYLRDHGFVRPEPPVTEAARTDGLRDGLLQARARLTALLDVLESSRGER